MLQRPTTANVVPRLSSSSERMALPTRASISSTSAPLADTTQCPALRSTVLESLVSFSPGCNCIATYGLIRKSFGRVYRILEQRAPSIVEHQGINHRARRVRHPMGRRPPPAPSAAGLLSTRHSHQSVAHYAREQRCNGHWGSRKGRDSLDQTLARPGKRTAHQGSVRIGLLGDREDQGRGHRP